MIRISGIDGPGDPDFRDLRVDAPVRSILRCRVPFLRLASVVFVAEEMAAVLIASLAPVVVSVGRHCDAEERGKVRQGAQRNKKRFLLTVFIGFF